MKKLLLTEFDTSDKKADYNDNTDTCGYILKNCTSMNSVKTSRQAQDRPLGILLSILRDLR
ncbi:hypothetical protein KAT67_09610, partial [candidate division WOR-3 bacterium]|nr:hypothetical protein [candidate division WOR-3 bacterium]